MVTLFAERISESSNEQKFKSHQRGAHIVKLFV